MSSNHPIEVEIKVPVADPDSLRHKLLVLHATLLTTVTQIDLYLSHPCRSFPETDEALRLRTTIDADGQSQFEVTYKGPKLDTTTKTREEFTVRLPTSETMAQIFQALGFTEVATVKKHRSFFKIDDAVLSIDIVDNVGTFMEIERVVESAELVDDARDDLIRLLHKLGFSLDQSIRESYLELYLRQLET